MIEYYQWQGHPDNPRDKGNYFFVAEPTRKITRSHGTKEEFQYLGWFYKEKHDELHFGTRINHTARPDLLQDVEVKLTSQQIQQMIKEALTYYPENV